MSVSGWKTSRLQNICSKIGSGATPRGGKESYFDQGPYSLIRSQNVLDFFFSYDGLAYIDETQASQLSNVDIQERDILLNITGDSVARVCQVPKSLLPARVNQHVSIIRPNDEIMSPEYLKYYLLNPRFKNYMLGMASVGGTRNALTKGMIEDFEIEHPDLPTQTRIAAILSSLDDKIEFNRQINATLEAIAQAIFKEWFVEFRYPGYTGEMQESELGLIPKGWKVGSFRDILNIEIGGDWGQDDPFEGGVAVISLRGTDLEQLKSFGHAPDAPMRWIKETSVKKRTISSTDILIAGSGLGPIGRSLYCDEHLMNMFSHAITYSNFCKKLRAEKPARAMYAERILELIYLNGDMKQYFTGTSIPNLDIKSLLSYDIFIPEDEIMEVYSDVIVKIKYDFLFNRENAILSQIRDDLLPKLMSGKIEV